MTRELATTTFKGMPLNEKIHLALDIGGFVCDPLDIVNAGIYLLEGRLGEAALSGAAIIPLAGIAGTGSKLLDKTIRWGDNAVAVVKAANKVEDGFSTVQSAYNYMLKSGRSRNVLQGVTAVSDNMANGVAKYGDEFLEQVVKKGTKEAKETAEELAETARKLNRAGLDEAIEGGLDAVSTPNSKVLRQNLIEAGVEVPDYPNAAHHIVAGSSPKAAEARAILQKYGIDINDAANGTFLPTIKDAAAGAYHPSLHTNAYYDKINKLLSEATCKEDVLDILEFIGDELNNGTFMQ